mgnify:CR=1 FL=1
MDGYSLVGGSRVLLVKLRQQILVLRAMLNLPGCNSVDLEEVNLHITNHMYLTYHFVV